MSVEVLVDLGVVIIFFIISLQLFLKKGIFFKLSYYNYRVRKAQEGNYNLNRLTKCMSLFSFMACLLFLCKLLLPGLTSAMVAGSLVVIMIVFTCVINSPFVRIK